MHAKPAQQRTSWGLAALVLPIIVTGAIALAQPAAPPDNGANDGGTNDASAATRGGEFVFSDVHIKETELSAALRMLTLQTKDNVVFSSKVDATQKVEANLYNVTFTEVLESLLTPLGLAYERKGNFIYIYTLKELEERKAKQRTAGSAVYSSTTSALPTPRR